MEDRYLNVPGSAEGSSAHLRVEAHLANTAGSVLPLGSRWESKGVMEDGVHLQEERVQKNPVQTFSSTSTNQYQFP